MRSRSPLAATLGCLVVLACAAPSSGSPVSGDDDDHARTVERIRDRLYSRQVSEANAAADSLLREDETRHGPESSVAYAARELRVECRLALRHRPDSTTCELAQRTLAYRVRTATGDSANALRSLQLAARCAHRSGDLEVGLSLQRRAIAIQERVSGPDAYEVSTQLNGLGSMLMDAGRYDEMRTVLERAIAIRLKTVHPDSTPVVMLRNNLAVALEASGDYAAALPLYESVLATYLVTLGPMHGKTGYALNNVAITRNATGDRRGARQLFERSLEVRQSTASPLEIAETMSNLGDRLLEDGEVSRARSLFRKALAIQTQHLRPDHRYRIQSLLGLAAASRSLDEHDDARRLAREALAAVEQSQSPEDLEAARALTALAETEVDAGNAAAAVPSLERALAMIERVLGDGAFRSEHPRAVLAEALRRLEDGRCLSEALESERVAREHLRRTIRVLPERQALSWRGSVRRGLDLALTCLASTPGRSDSAVAAVWDAVVRSRGLVLDELVSRLHFDPGADTAVHRLANAFVVARRREVNLAVRGPRNESESEFRATLVDAAREADEAEAALARRSAAYRTRFERGAIGLAEVKAARPANAALVSYIRYQSPRLPSLEAPPETVAGRHPAGDHYAAFVLRNDAGPPMFVPLGTAGEIDSLVARWHIAARSQAPDEANYRRVAGALRARAWDPIARHLEDAPVVCLTPDDALALVNFDTLPLGARGYLIERGPLVLYLTMERDLVAGPRAPGVGGHLLAVGGVDYDAEPGAPRAASPSPASTPGSSSRGAGVGCAVLDSMRFVALPQSRAEIEDVRELWARSAPGRRVRALSGSAATEEAFRANAPTCRVLHLATHGFFIDGDCNPAPAGPDAGVIDGTAEDADLPLVRSGLALAGANGRRRTAIAADDGILTAAEVATLDLDAVEGVVLSGCETGLGAPANLEGLIGLRRAFQVAGAKTLVMSLWGVEDAPARRWVRTFYETLTRGRSSHVAVRDASRALLAAQRAAGLGGHPAAWGAFTSCGTR